MSQATAPTPDKVVVGPVDAAQETVLTSRVQRELLCEIHSGFCAVGDMKLLEDDGGVIPDGLVAEPEFNGNLLIRFALRYE